jgi:hypothetical protein
MKLPALAENVKLFTKFVPRNAGGQSVASAVQTTRRPRLLSTRLSSPSNS